MPAADVMGRARRHAQDLRRAEHLAAARRESQRQAVAGWAYVAGGCAGAVPRRGDGVSVVAQFDAPSLALPRAQSRAREGIRTRLRLRPPPLRVFARGEGWGGASTSVD